MCQKKVFVLDTNVILHDSSCIKQFGRHLIVVPITVLEELDNFKRGNRTLNFHAREFIRILDELDSALLFNGGATINDSGGKISLKMESKQHSRSSQFKISAKNDHRILNIACHLVDTCSDAKVIFVSKDVNCRMKARAIGLVAQDYTTDHVNVDAYTGSRIITSLSSTFIDTLYADNSVQVNEEFVDLYPNEFFVLQNGQQRALAIYKKNNRLLHLVKNKRAFGIVPRNAEQIFAIHALQDRDVPLVTLAGRAGTGKTLLALASALEVYGQYEQILLARPTVSLSDKEIGYVPGDIDAKLSPYMKPLFDNLSVIKQNCSKNAKMCEQIEDMLKFKQLAMEPLAFIRGRSLVKMFVIIDEAQNLTPLEVKTIITRAGEGTKIVFTGDINQIDHPYLDRHSNGLSHVIGKMQGQQMYAHITLLKGERSSLADLASKLL